jgi:hypothetical protein
MANEYFYLKLSIVIYYKEHKLRQALILKEVYFVEFLVYTILPTTSCDAVFR